MRPCFGRAVRGSLLAAALLVALCHAPAPPAMNAGEALRVGGPSFGSPGQYLVWNTANISYRVDGGMLGTLNNMTAVQMMVDSIFGLWQAVPTSAISFTNAGPITGGPSGSCATGGDVDTINDYNCLSMNNFAGNPIIFDRDGSIIAALGMQNNSILGFAGPVSTPLGHIAGFALLNGRFIDGINMPPSNREVSPQTMQGVALHEFGHFIGLGHSQINNNCLTDLNQPGNTCTNFSDDTFGLPTMYPIALPILEAANTPPELTLSLDDIAWVSLLYPDPTFSSTHGLISGTLFASDSLSAIQGGNIIARQANDPATANIDESRRCAVSIVSGELYTGNAGQSITGDNSSGDQFGSRDPSLFGMYRVPVPVNPAGLGPAACAMAATTGTFTVEVESINSTFTGSSSVGPNGNTLGEVIPIPGPAEFHSGPGESSSDSGADAATPVVVTAGNTTSGIAIILDGTPNTNDALEGSGRNDTVATATPIAVGTTPASISPVLSSGADIDVYSFTAMAGETLQFDINARTLTPMSFLDPVLEIVDSGGTRVNLCRATTGSGLFTAACLNDDEMAGVVRDSLLEFQSSSAGTFFVRVFDWTGGARADFRYDLVVSVGAADFALSANPTAATVARGQSGMSTITATPMNGAFASAITFSCSGLPAQSACVFTPTSVTPGASPATTQLTITTTAPAMIPGAPLSYRWTPPPVYELPLTLLALLLFAAGVTLKRTRAPAWLLGGGAGWGGVLSACRALRFQARWSASGHRTPEIGEARRYIAPRNRAIARACHVAAVLTLVGLAVACGGGGGGGATPPPPNQGTPTGTFSVTVRGTAGAIQRTTVVTLTVQ